MFIRKYKFILLSGFVTLLVFSSLGFGSSVAQFIDTDPLVQFEENGHYYQAIYSPLSWHDARDYCAGLDGHLVTISSDAENQFVYEMLRWSWLGATDEVSEGNWLWVTGEPWEYENWAPGEPNNCCPPEYCGGDSCTPENFLGFWGDPYTGEWNDVPYGVSNFICEWDTIHVNVDIKPASCPNPLNVDDMGVLPVAILGTADFEVNEIDPASVRLEGVAPLRWSWEDVATPYEPWTGNESASDCNDFGPDGYVDLTLKFDAQEILSSLGQVSDNDILLLQLTGKLMDGFGGTALIGEDVVKIIKTIKPTKCNELVLLESFASPEGSQPHGLAFDGVNLWSVGYDTDTIYKLNMQGDILSSFASPGHGPTGLTFDGTYLWNADDGSLKIYTLDTSGNVISSFDAPGIDSTGLTFEGQYLWNADFNWNIPGGYLHRIDVSNPDDISFTTYASPGEGPEGLAFDGKYLWHVDLHDNNIYKLDTSANVLCTYQSFGTNPIGLTFDGTYLWLSDFSTRTIYKIDIGGK